MNAQDEESDDGLMLAGDGVVGSGYNQLMLEDPNLDLNIQKMKEQSIISSWIQWFLALEDHDFLVEVDADFITDKMNLLKLSE